MRGGSRIYLFGQFMKKIILYNPAISSLNLGDHIIGEACKENLNNILEENMCIEISTHLPISNTYMKFINNVEYSFVLGSNLLMPKMDARFRQWDIKKYNVKKISPVILMGVGWHQYSKKTTIYTKNLYKKILSNKYFHSVRDEYTKKKLNEIGINNVINTGCPTFWSLTKEHCQKIPKEKSVNVIFTLTDYNRDIEKDERLISILKKNYEKVFFWIQGSDDLEYLESIDDMKGIEIIGPSLKVYDEVLNNYDVDFIGTRLHGGIRALQHKRRSLIIAIDNRAIEINKNYNIPILKRESIDLLEEILTNPIETDIKLPIENIKKWKAQFER